MSRQRLIRLTARSLWLRVWPAWTAAIFLLLIPISLLPGGYLRAALALPIVLMVPGSLALGAVFGRFRKAETPMLVAYAALLGVILLVIVSLAIYAVGLKITAVHTFWGSFIASTVAAIIAQARILAAPKPVGEQAEPVGEQAEPVGERVEPVGEQAERAAAATAARTPVANDDDIQPGTQQRRAAYYSAGAIAIGLGILAAGVYAWDHIGHPAPVGYTAIAWTGVRNNGVVAIGSSGKDLTFEIIHQQPDFGAYSLTAGFMGQPSRLIAGPLRIKAAPDKTLTGRLHVPSLNSGCTYRLIVTLTALQPDATLVKTSSWSIDLNVYGLSQPPRRCG